MSRRLHMFHAPDGAEMASAIRAAFAAEADLRATDASEGPPPAHEGAVAVFLLTPGAFEAPGLSEGLRQWTDASFPVLPVVPEIARYDFAGLPEGLAPLRRFNAVGWDQGAGDGEEVFRAVRLHLGIVPFKRSRKVFISYRRSDGRDAALEIHNHLHDQGFRVFLDTEAMEPGDPVQDRIDAAISERDCLLLVDSPKAPESDWVMTEVTRALERRTAVCAVRLPGSPGFPLLRDMPGIPWDPMDSDRFGQLETFISGVIASKESFDVRADRTIREIATLLNATFKGRQKRQLRLLASGEGESTGDILVEFEDSPHSLDRLYRLFRSYREAPRPVAAFFLHNGLPLSVLERDAVTWSSHGAPLRVLALSELDGAVREVWRR